MNRPHTTKKVGTEIEGDLRGAGFIQDMLDLGSRSCVLGCGETHKLGRSHRKVELDLKFSLANNIEWAGWYLISGVHDNDFL